MNILVKTRNCLVLLGIGCLISACTESDAPVTSPEEPPSVSSESQAASSPENQGIDTPNELTWTGCDISKKAYITDLVAAYTEDTGVLVSVKGGGATRGIRTVAGKSSDIGGTCRHSLQNQFPEAEGNIVHTHVAWDALVFFTHPDNPVSNISSDMARKVLQGDIRNWSNLGGPDALILPAFRQQTVMGKLSGVGYMTRLLLFEDPDVEYTSDAIFHTSSGPIEKYIESTSLSFAVTGVSSARKRNVKILSLDGVAATKENIASGAYGLYRPLYLVAHESPSAGARDFLKWVLSAEGQDHISTSGTVNLSQGAALVDVYKHWPENM